MDETKVDGGFGGVAAASRNDSGAPEAANPLKKIDEVPIPAVAGRAGRGLVGPLLAKSVSLGLVASLVALGLTSPLGAAGAFVGCLAAGLYAAGYLTSHIGSARRERFFDSRIARSAILRMAAVAAAGFGAYAVGRQTFIAYLSAFGLAFGVLVISEIPRARHGLRTRGVIG